MRIKRFNESVNEKILLIKEIISDFLDDVNINTIDVKETSLSIGSLGKIILKMEKIEAHPAIINHIYHDRGMKIIGNKSFNSSLKFFNPLVAKYKNWKSISVEVRFDRNRLEVISKLESCIEVIESYGFIMTSFEKLKHSRMIIVEFCYEK